MAKHFDVVVVGAGLGALAAAALLAKRSWRVLVVGHTHRDPLYHWEGMPLLRRPYAFVAGGSPLWGAILGELGQAQHWKRKQWGEEGGAQWIAPAFRADAQSEATLLADEVALTFPDLRRSVETHAQALGEALLPADAAFLEGIDWPPEGYWDNRRMERMLATIPYLGAPGPGGSLDPWSPLPGGHPYREALEGTARFLSHSTGALTPFAMARLLGLWWRRRLVPQRGESDVLEWMQERIEAHGGEVHWRERVASVVQEKGKVRGIFLDGDDRMVGADFLLTDLDTRSLLKLVEAFEPKAGIMEQLPQLAPRYRRFVVTAVVQRRGLPEKLRHEALLTFRPRLSPGAFRPEAVVALLQRYGGPNMPTLPGLGEGLEVLSMEARLPWSATFREGPRELLWESLTASFPFLERHTLVVDSPSDGEPLWDLRSGLRVPVERALLRAGGGRVDREEHQPWWEVAPSAFHGLAAEPQHAPLKGALLVGPSVLPALGQEGELLAAVSAVRRVAGTDGSRDKLRRSMGAKMELP
jgi:hypothetical protein